MKKLSIFLLLTYFSLNANSQTFVAKLKDGIDSADLVINSSKIVGKVYKNEKFIVYKYDFDEPYLLAWTKSGNSGSINSRLIELLPNEKIFQMHTDTSILFQIACGRHSMENFSSFGINYCTEVKEAVYGNEKTLLSLFLIFDTLYAAPAETHIEIMWQIFNNWSDHNFSLFLKKQSQHNFLKIMNVFNEAGFSYPVNDLKYYYSTYYPETWTVIKDYIDLTLNNTYTPPPD